MHAILYVKSEAYPAAFYDLLTVTKNSMQEEVDGEGAYNNRRSARKIVWSFSVEGDWPLQASLAVPQIWAS